VGVEYSFTKLGETLAGDYCNAQPESIHGESYTKAGCLFILSACQSDEVLL
jgi:hypothetical protein